jgi:hypothetical protein
VWKRLGTAADSSALSTTSAGYWVEIIKRSEKAAKPRFTLSQVGQPQFDRIICTQPKKIVGLT